MIQVKPCIHAGGGVTISMTDWAMDHISMDKQHGTIVRHLVRQSVVSFETTPSSQLHENFTISTWKRGTFNTHKIDCLTAWRNKNFCQVITISLLMSQQAPQYYLVAITGLTIILFIVPVVTIHNSTFKQI